MSRYRFTGTKIDKDTGNRVMKTTLYPEIKINDGDVFVCHFVCVILYVFFR